MSEIVIKAFVTVVVGSRDWDDDEVKAFLQRLLRPYFPQLLIRAQQEYSQDAVEEAKKEIEEE